MDKLNFINPVPSSTHRELNRWALITFLLIGGASCTVMVLTALQGSIYYELHKKCTTRQAETNNATSLSQQHSEKQHTLKSKKQQHQKINRYATHPKSAAPLLSQISAVINPANIQACSITKGSFELNCIAPTAQAAQQQVQKLAQLEEVSAATLISLNKEQNSFKTTIRGTINKKKSRS